jgi:hypothetical protein
VDQGHPLLVSCSPVPALPYAKREVTIRKADGRQPPASTNRGIR